MGKRRDAERAVIDAAREVRRWKGPDPTGFAWWMAIQRLDRAVETLEAIEAIEHAAPANAGAPQTSEEAARWMAPNVGNLVGEVFREILMVHRQGNVGLTTDAIEQRLRRSHQTVSPRVTDLRDKWLIEESGHFGKTRSGRKAVLWRPTARGIEMASLIKAWSW